MNQLQSISCRTVLYGFKVNQMNFLKVISSTYFLILFLCLFSCTYHDSVHVYDCTNSTLALSLNAKSNPTGCSTTDGSITVLASGGLPPYTYSSNGVTFQSSSVLQNLGSGSFTVVVKDANTCTKSLVVTLSNSASTLDATATTTADSGCSTHNGTITVVGSGGVTPYQYELNTNGYSTTSKLTTLASGTYSISIKDSKGCVKSISATVAAAAGTASYATDVAPLLTTYCNTSGCHSANSGRSLTTYTQAQANASSIKSRTASGNMPPGGGLSQAQISVIACWVNGGALNN